MTYRQASARSANPCSQANTAIAATPDSSQACTDTLRMTSRYHWNQVKLTKLQGGVPDLMLIVNSNTQILSVLSKIIVHKTYRPRVYQKNKVL